jgi:hypothetical protein
MGAVMSRQHRHRDRRAAHARPDRGLRLALAALHRGGLKFVLARIEHLATVSIVTRGASGTIAEDSRLTQFDRSRGHAHRARPVRITGRGTARFSRRRRGRPPGKRCRPSALKHRPPQSRDAAVFPAAVPRVVVGEAVAGPVAPGTWPTAALFGRHFGAPISELTRYRLRGQGLRLEDPAGLVAGTISLRADAGRGRRGRSVCAARATGKWRLTDEREYQFAARSNGNLDR